MSDRNRTIIEEFRANEGRVGGNFAGRPMLLLTHTGARSGRTYTHPLVYLPHEGRLVVFASKGGAPTNPDWYHNLRAHPTATVEVGTETYEVDAAEVHGAERDRLYASQKEISPAFGDYEKRTSRRIPVIALTRKA
jgi:deazaflavin-dependent oxidoreductase (nitroreductase family)